MSVELTRSKKILFTISCFLISIISMAEMGITPFVYNLYTAFDNTMLVNYIVSGSQFFMVLASVTATFLMKKVNKKHLLLFGSTIFSISSIFCASFDNVYYICFMRTLMGLSEGIITAVTMAYIAQLYIDEKKRAAFMGYYNAAMAIFSAAMSYISGELASSDWHNAFNLYWPSLLVIIGIALFFPNLAIPEEKTAKGETPKKKEGLGILFFIFAIDYILFCWLYCMFTFFISAYLPEKGIGGTSEAGIALSIAAIAGFLLSPGFGKIYGKLRKNTSLIPLIFASASMLIIYFFPSLTVVYIASFFIGGSFRIYFTYSYAYVSEIVPISRIDDAMGYTTELYGLAFFCFTYINTFVLSIISENGEFSPGFAFWGCTVIIAIIIELITNKTYQKHIKSKVL